MDWSVDLNAEQIRQGAMAISMTPWRICSAFRSMLQSIFCIIRIFQHVRPAGLFRATLVVVFCHCLLPLFFTPTASCPRSSLIVIFFFRSVFRYSFSFLLLPCFLSTRSHSLPTVVQRTHKRLYHVRTPSPPPPLYNGGKFAKSISVWRLDFVHETTVTQI